MEIAFTHRGFEAEVRKSLGIYGRPITKEDALLVTKLDLSNFDFMEDDWDAISLFSNLTALDIDIGYTTPGFWMSFPKMKHLYLCSWGRRVDFSSFREMRELEMLWVSGGDYSDIDYLDLDALAKLKHLHYLSLHEFGCVDLLPLGDMPQLKSFALRYAKKVSNIEVIGTMNQLEELVLDGLYVDSLDFLDTLPDTLRLEMCGNHVYGGVDPQKWKRFSKHDICEISVGDQPRIFIDLPTLHTAL